MSIGSFILPLYLAAVVALAYLVWRQQYKQRNAYYTGSLCADIEFCSWQAPAFYPLLTLAALLLSTGIMLYTGAEIAVVKGRPYGTPIG